MDDASLFLILVVSISFCAECILPISLPLYDSLHISVHPEIFDQGELEVLLEIGFAFFLKEIHEIFVPSDLGVGNAVERF